jgi:hypothetical protein
VNSVSASLSTRGHSCGPRPNAVDGDGFSGFGGHLVTDASCNGLLVEWSIGRADAVKAHRSRVGLQLRERGCELFLLRSGDGGRSWSTRRQIDADAAALAGEGSAVDLVTLRDGRVWYARSANAGKSFSAASPLSDVGDIRSIDVARGDHGEAAVIWRVSRGPTVIRASSDGGQSFGDAHSVTTAVGVRSPRLAVGDGVIYVAYENPQYRPGYDINLKIRRSTDGGASWSRPTPVLEALGWSLSAEGSTAYVAYERWSDHQSSARFSSVYQMHTSNSGASWTAPRLIAPPSWDAEAPSIEIDEGVAHAVFGRCDPSWDTCDNMRLIYRSTTDGVSWSSPERVSPKSLYEAYSAEVGVVAGHVFVMFEAYTWTGGSLVVQERHK